MKDTKTLVALAALLGVGAYAVSQAQAAPAMPKPKSPGAGVPKQPLQPPKGPQDIPGDVDVPQGNPQAVVTPPPPDKMAQAQSMLGFAKAAFVAETLTRQTWQISVGIFGGGLPASQVLNETKAGRIYDPASGAWEPNDRPQRLQALLHSNLSDAVVRYKPTGPDWTDLDLPGVWYLVAEQA